MSTLAPESLSAASPATVLPLSSTHFKSLIELSSVALDSTIESYSDDFFASVHNLIKVGPPINYPGQFGPNGSIMDGWESRRHNRKHDWAIIKLGAKGSIHGFEIDTRWFDGNECPRTDVWGAQVEVGNEIENDSPQWKQILPLTNLGPAQQHFLLLERPQGSFTHLKITQHPDGGIGRFRAYGIVEPPTSSPSSSDTAKDLGSILNGGRVVATSDEHYGVGSYILLPGRGKDMEDGWHTRRSRGRLDTDQGDWLIVKLGQPGYLEWADIDTKDFKGNFPDQVSLWACGEDQPGKVTDEMAGWTMILERQGCSAHQHHVRELREKGKKWTHVCLRIYPDGGLKRLRLFGRAAEEFPDYEKLTPLSAPIFTDDEAGE